MLLVIEEKGKDIRPSCADSKGAREPLKEASSPLGPWLEWRVPGRHGADALPTPATGCT